MEVWEEIETNPERGSQRLIDEYGNRLYAAASLLCPDFAAAEDLVFRTLAQTVRKIDGTKKDDCRSCDGRDIEEAEWFAGNADAFCLCCLLAGLYRKSKEKEDEQNDRDDNDRVCGGVILRGTDRSNLSLAP